MLEDHNVRLVSLLDNDFYKFTMQCAVVKLFPSEVVKYDFINRGKHEYPEGFADELKKAVNAMSQLRLTKEEKQFLKKTCPYLDLPYIDFLEGYRYDPSEVQIKQEGTSLEVQVSGLWYRTILWEVPLLCLISELYYSMKGLQREDDETIIQKTIEKEKKFKTLQVPFAEFGTRRRHSYRVHRLVMQALTSMEDSTFTGSSNVHMAMLYNVKPIGTHAHEWFMFHAAEYGFKMANSLSLEHWVDVYRGDLGVALSDTYTTDVFFQQFDKKFAKLFDGVRHDSGDPIEFANKTIEHYKKHGINPLFKYIIFSDALNPEKVEEITKACRGRIGISFGIGTNLTNDVGLAPSNIVMKLISVKGINNEWIPTVKLSDEKGKYTGDPKMIELAKEFLQIKN
ncbi:nicotinate phosphoribosyltransferase [Elizabethkingia ursingii]|jgi:nicotinate phosphoribosyltransferase|uniref:Nicotinate phosphoribosyltransferase n=1 Tax=Elizabethkingia ursingii TaxID=1756150 RepID=A0AAJ3TQE9_9FLAO|nr:nicotinate phosphoribosyltransferase [Elizabethkingia ursingii]MDR2230568.1 nicotinate phosphoribosyltransferase [Flavobacteriaceae bacterium]AQX08539.1 nicotinate phosphoribosyltransferase [Elizabethkingia ursingii]MCL1663547.1 nicotinate phosphoribosyltransferase [Elizabethkingia ursingii]MCL1673464.1 nicotinate phosphoribosyltransferase [Elizabethkingia ursingii]OPB77994.1 nicotinate phosphoribosyltransferase [Elizabethkingia ursingii]